jgi:hypothetical protein
MYLAIASCVASSSQDSGRCTMRVAISMSSIAASDSSACSSTRASAPAADAAVVMHLQRANARRQVDDARRSGALQPRSSARARAAAAPDRAPAARIRPADYGRRRAGRRRPAALRRRGRRARIGDCGRRRSRRRRAFAGAAPAPSRDDALLRRFGASRRLGGVRRESHPIVGPQLAELPQLRLHERHGTDEAAERGSIGPQITGMSPVKSTLPIA